MNYKSTGWFLNFMTFLLKSNKKKPFGLVLNVGLCILLRYLQSVMESKIWKWSMPHCCGIWWIILTETTRCVSSSLSQSGQYWGQISLSLSDFKVFSPVLWLWLVLCYWLTDFIWDEIVLSKKIFQKNPTTAYIQL